MRTSSLEALKDLPQLHINRQEKRILIHVMRYKDRTRREIANSLNMETSTVSARVNSMVAWGILDEHAEKRKCKVSGRTVNVVSA